LKPGEKIPKGVKIQKGARGGKFYYTKDIKNTNTSKPTKDTKDTKKTIDKQSVHNEKNGIIFKIKTLEKINNDWEKKYEHYMSMGQDKMAEVAYRKINKAQEEIDKYERKLEKLNKSSEKNNDGKSKKIESVFKSLGIKNDELEGWSKDGQGYFIKGEFDKGINIYNRNNKWYIALEDEEGDIKDEKVLPDDENKLKELIDDYLFDISRSDY